MELTKEAKEWITEYVEKKVSNHKRVIIKLKENLMLIRRKNQDTIRRTNIKIFENKGAINALNELKVSII